MTIEELIHICKSYVSLGWAIQEQLDSVVENDMNEENINMNALGWIEGWLQEVDGLADVSELYTRIEEYHNWED